MDAPSGRRGLAPTNQRGRFCDVKGIVLKLGNHQLQQSAGDGTSGQPTCHRRMGRCNERRRGRPTLSGLGLLTFLPSSRPFTIYCPFSCKSRPIATDSLLKQSKSSRRDIRGQQAPCPGPTRFRFPGKQCAQTCSAAATFFLRPPYFLLPSYSTNLRLGTKADVRTTELIVRLNFSSQRRGNHSTSSTPLTRACQASLTLRLPNVHRHGGHQRVCQRLLKGSQDERPEWSRRRYQRQIVYCPETDALFASVQHHRKVRTRGYCTLADFGHG